MKKTASILALCLTAITAAAQNRPQDTAGGQWVTTTNTADAGIETDTTVQKSIPFYLVDSTCLGKSIFDVMPSRLKGDAGTAKIHQSDSIRVALERHIISNYSREIPGYRIRIYFSNEQNAREQSAAAAAKFSAAHPEHAVYRIYTSPNFKVTVGDFRNKSDALRLLGTLKEDFPYAFIVRENIKLY